MTRSARNALAFTLIEVLIALALGMFMIAAAWSTFTRSRDAIERATNRVSLHRSASLIRDQMERDLGLSGPLTAVFLRSTPQTAAGSDKVDTVEFLAMRTTAPLRTNEKGNSQEDSFRSEYHWIRWRFQRRWRDVNGSWIAAESKLLRSDSTPTRYWKATSALAPASSVVTPRRTTTTYDGFDFINIPRPLRDASGGISSLDNNRYGHTTAQIRPEYPYGDIGDLADLELRERPFSLNVLDLRIGILSRNGTAQEMSSDAAATWNINGIYSNVVGPSGFGTWSTDLGARPQLYRIGITLSDPKTGLMQDFAFSIAAPAIPITVTN
jgi:type II secretory pathway pseudopilin PulG